MPNQVVITGIGMITPLGQDPMQVLADIERGKSAAAPPEHFDASLFACPVCAQVKDFQAERYVSEPKMLRLMSRDSRFSVAAAHLALQDAHLRVGEHYRPEEIALFGATGLAGMPLDDITALIKASVTPDGQFDLQRFGRDGLRSVNPILSFKILSNMPVCFVSICENIQGPNAIYTPWEGQGAQAIEAGFRAIRDGEAPCAVVGGCDVKTHELAFISLERQGLFQSWKDHGAGMIPGEGAVFMVLEEEGHARTRAANIYARLVSAAAGTHRPGSELSGTYVEVLRQTLINSRPPLSRIVAAADGDDRLAQAEIHALTALAMDATPLVYPKPSAGNLFAGAAALQVSIAALLAPQSSGPVLAHCFGHGSEQAAFLLVKP